MNTRRMLMGIGLGLVLFALQSVLTFLPWSPALSALVFGGIGYTLAFRSIPDGWALLWMGLIPPLLLTAVFVFLVREHLHAGVGTNHLINLGLIPLAGFGGYLVGQHLRSKRAAA